MIALPTMNYARSVSSASTCPPEVIRQMNGGGFVLRNRLILGKAARIASIVSTPLALPPVNTKAATFAEMSASRSMERSRMFWSRVRTIQPSCPTAVSHSTSLVSCRNRSLCRTTVKPRDRSSFARRFPSIERSRKRTRPSSGFAADADGLESDRFFDFFRRLIDVLRDRVD